MKKAKHKKSFFGKFINFLGKKLRKSFHKKPKLENYTYNRLLNLLLLYDKPNGANLSEEYISEQYLITNIISIKNKRIQDIMIPRIDIVGIEDSAIDDSVYLKIAKSGFSRLPVYKENLDNVIGFIHVKDLVISAGKQTKLNLHKLIRPVLFISPYMKLFDALYEMKTKRIHMAIVVDEFGGVDGLVTFEDIVEEIVGDIVDEHDKMPLKLLKTHKNGVIEADARVSIEELEDQIGQFVTPEEREEYNTIAGLVASLSGYIPSQNEVVVHSSGVEFRILAADTVKIKKVAIDIKKFLAYK